MGAAFPARANGLTTLARVLLAKGQIQEALAASQESMEMLHSGLASIEEGEILFRLVFAEALYANGLRREALAAIQEAHTQLLSVSAKIKDAKLRESFLSRVPENLRTLALQRAWFVV